MQYSVVDFVGKEFIFTALLQNVKKEKAKEEEQEEEERDLGKFM
jgi:hypothetical protein